jgi:hypothetical protein
MKPVFHAKAQSKNRRRKGELKPLCSSLRLRFLLCAFARNCFGSKEN